MKAFSDKTVGVAIIMVALLALSYGLGFYQGVKTTSVEYSQPSGPRSEVTAQVIRNGKVIYEFHQTNVVTTIMSKRVRNWLGFSNATAQDNTVTAISLSASSSTPDKAWTVLPSEETTNGLSRHNCTGSEVTVLNATAYQLEHEFTYTGTSITIRLSGVNWDTSGDGNLAFAATINDAPLSQNDKLKMTWKINCPDG